jgi:hypothetical protein
VAGFRVKGHPETVSDTVSKNFCKIAALGEKRVVGRYAAVVVKPEDRTVK